MSSMLSGKYRFVLLFCVLLPEILFSGCASSDFFKCPYVIEDVHVEVGKVEELHEFAGAYFSVYNSSSKDIHDITVSFLVYDENGNNPFIGPNCVVSKIPVEIASGEEKNCVVNLDSYISLVPQNPFLLDFVYIREIRYEDGDKWQDPFGMHALKEIYEQ